MAKTTTSKKTKTTKQVATSRATSKTSEAKVNKTKTTTKKAPTKTTKSSVKSVDVKVPKTPLKITFGSLRKWNIGLGLLLAVQAIVIGVVGKSSSFAITNNFLTIDSLASKSAGHNIYAPAAHHMLDINLVLVIAFFLGISAIIHLLTATYYRRRYENELDRRTNKLRWLDYGLSAGVMLMAIALLNGAGDVASLLMVFVLVALLHICGYFLETQSAATMRAKMYIFIGILIAGAAVWLVIASYVKGAIMYGDGLPHFIYWIDGTIFALTLAIAANTYFSFRQRGKWADYLFGERMYMILSFVTKTALAWQIFANVLR